MADEKPRTIVTKEHLQKVDPAANPSGDPVENGATAKATVNVLAVTNVILALFVLGIAGGFVYLRFFYAPEPDPEMWQPYVAEAQERLKANREEIETEAVQLAQEVLPVVRQAITQQVQEDYPKYVRVLENQGDKYLADVEEILVRKLKHQYRDYLRVHRDVIKEEFPEYASEQNVEAVLNDFDDTLNDLIQRYYLDEFRRQVRRTIALWKQFEPLDRPGPNEPSLAEQLADYFSDWTVLAATESGNDEG